MTWFDAAVDLAQDYLLESVSPEIHNTFYTRNRPSLGELTASFNILPYPGEGDTIYENDYRINVMMQRFMVRRSDLEDAGFGLPQIGDKIRIDYGNGNWKEYEVHPGNFHERHYENHDRRGRCLILHANILGKPT